MSDSRFYICEHCGNLVGMINDAGVPLVCCGQKMTKLEPGTVEASHEKHPMLEAHSILWVYLQTNKGGHRKCLEVGGAPEVEFALTEDEKPVAAYAYCNLHGLWKADI